MGRLDQYHGKRDFGRTPEPKGRVRRRKGDHTYVIQKHAARRLHYDLRLELDGVLLSWAVPKGPSLDPAERRLAVRTEDHPVEYADFEGVIPEGEYGAGTVLLWDRGRWEERGDPQRALEKGHLTFSLLGERLHGEWNLVRMGDGKDWLLIKRSDGEAREGGEPTGEQTGSVATGRDLDAVERDRDRVWHSDGGEERLPPAPEPGRVKGGSRGRLPREFAPQLATLVRSAPEGDEWLHEIKLDGYRILAFVRRGGDGGSVRLVSRNGKDWTRRFGAVADALAGLPAQEALLDGEVVVLDRGGRSDFQRLQNALRGDGEGLVYFAFDLLHLDGVDLRGAPLVERKALLQALLDRMGGREEGRVVRACRHVRGRGELFLRHACDLGLEGVVSKRADASYRSGRGRAWLKVKCTGRQELVIGGYTEPSGSRSGFGALLVGAWAGDELRFLGRVGTGFDERTLADLSKQLRRLERDRPPFAEAPPDARGRRAHWVEPELVAEVEYAERTDAGLLRHPVFRGLREDKDPRTVVEESSGGGPETGAAPPAPPIAGVEALGVRLTHPDRVLYGEVGLTKGELAEHYVRVAERMLPHVAGRPLTLLRCPRGQGGACFYQKHADDSTPDAVHRVVVKEGEAPYTMVDTVEGLVGLVQMGVLEIHTWGSRADRLERPDVLVFDLDPGPGVGAQQLVEAARAVRELLGTLGLASFAKLTGGKGVHVVVPVVRRLDWPDAKAFCKAVAQALASDAPERFTAVASKDRRHGKVFVDYLRNAREATAVAPYSTRARAGAPVAVPIRWEELRPSLRPDHYTVPNLARRLAALKGDPWEGFAELNQSIRAQARRTLGL